MKISFVLIGKTTANYLKEGIKEYEKRLTKYIHFEQKVIPHLKNAKKLSTTQIKTKEGELLLKQWSAQDFVILLDENGKQQSSVDFANYLQILMNRGISRITFVVGGAYGFSDAVYQRANAKLALSKMTFSHQMVRLIFVEQLYRGFSILNHEPYHHQ